MQVAHCDSYIVGIPYTTLRYSGIPLIKTPFVPSASGWIIELSSFQGLWIEHRCGLSLKVMQPVTSQARHVEATVQPQLSVPSIIRTPELAKSTNQSTKVRHVFDMCMRSRVQCSHCSHNRAK